MTIPYRTRADGEDRRRGRGNGVGWGEGAAAPPARFRGAATSLARRRGERYKNRLRTRGPRGAWRARGSVIVSAANGAWERLARKARKAPVRAWQLLLYIYYHKLVYRIDNTKFNISFTVFRESFLGDQYRIRKFSRQLDGAESLLFIDLGRNHGFVFFYFLHELARRGTSLKSVRYIGCDPSPLKFVYHPHPPAGLDVSYRLLDRAIVFDDAKTVKLKYGERNLGNFNVSGSSFEARMAKAGRRYEFIEIEVDAISAEETIDLVRGHDDYDAVIVKIDCKNRTEQLMESALDVLEGRTGPWLTACERDGSGSEALARRAELSRETAVASNRSI